MGVTELRAVLWDLDGTLVDSEPYWIRTEMEVAARNGGTWTQQDGLSVVGKPVGYTLERMIAAGVDLSADQLRAEIFVAMSSAVRTRGVPYRPGARELRRQLAAAGVAQALVTMSFGPYVQALLEQLDPFDAVLTGDRVEHGKPAPDIYLAALAALGLRPAQALALEDSDSGAGAILAAGVTPVVVPYLVDIPQDPRLVRISSLEGVTAHSLALLHAEWQGAAARGSQRT